MSLGNQVCCSVMPQGRFRYFVGDGTPTPGCVLQFKAAVEPVAGQFQCEVYNRSFSGDFPQGPLLVCLEDELQGKVRTDAYADGDQVKTIVPLAGEEYNMLVANLTGSGSGTLDDVAIGGLWVPEDGTGKLIDAASFGGSLAPVIKPFMSMETLASLAADAHVWMIYTGY